ncbi:MAG TPA: hypothetical protein VF516_46255 [Kofleriaceae bacterium]
MTKIALPCILALAFIAIPTTAAAQSIVTVRCTTDSLDATAALQRIEWARRCALLTNTGGPNSWFFSTLAADDVTFVGAKDYREIDPNHAYSGSVNDYNVNYSYSFCRYPSSSIFSVIQETSGPTAGFWKWSRPVQRPRVFYPTFDTTMTGTGTQLFPLPTLPGECKLYQRNPTTGGFSRWTGNFYVLAYCVST